jgi:hypothetical protein
MKSMKLNSQTLAAAKAGMNAKTARKYIKGKKLPSELKKGRIYLTREDCFKSDWSEIEMMLRKAPELQAPTILSYLIENYPEKYQRSQLRTLQRRMQLFRAEYGNAKAVIFCQKIKPGRSSQSDWTVMNDLRISISGALFRHLIYHFMLPYSCWETFMICYTESFETLSQGYEKAVWELGGTLPEHRTDNLSAATKRCGNRRTFTEKWQAFMGHYGVKPTRNNPGESHENGSVEKSHDIFKNAVNQHLLLRGSRDFADLPSYEDFLNEIKDKRNLGKQKKVKEEIQFLGLLPERKWNDPESLWVKVSYGSTIQVRGCTYSVPSHLKGYTLRVNVYFERLEICYGHKTLFNLTRVASGKVIDYRHIIDSLIRKPGAFKDYQYQEFLFPSFLFRWAYDCLLEDYPITAHKLYLQLLLYAKMYGESQVKAALQICKESSQSPQPDTIKNLVDPPDKFVVEPYIMQPHLELYDKLHGFREKGELVC